MTLPLMILLACPGSTPTGGDTATGTDDTATPGPSADDTATRSGTPDCADDPWWPDADADGFGDPNVTPQTGCERPDSAWVANARDCDDGNEDAWPGAEELCDEADNDCDDQTDEDVSLATWWVDQDEDGTGDPKGESVERCEQPAGYADNDLDCDDRDRTSPAFVDTSGTPGASGSMDDPTPSIADAYAGGASCILVNPGTYLENLALTRGVTITGVGGSAVTTVGPSDQAAIMTVEFVDTEVKLVGLTLAEGTGYLSESSSGSTLYELFFAGGIYLYQSKLVLDDVVFRDMRLPQWQSSSSSSGTTYRYGLGAGIYGYYGDVVMTDVAFVRATGAYGAAMYLYYSSLDMTRVRVDENTADYAVMELYDVALHARNLQVAQNVSGYGDSILAQWGGSADIAFATFADNQAYGTIDWEWTEGLLTDSIVEGEYYGVLDWYSTGSYDRTNWWVTYYGNYNGPTANDPGHLFVDPKFESRDLSDLDRAYHLDPGSQCVDYGDRTLQDHDGTQSDLGAFGGPEAWN